MAGLNGYAPVRRGVYEHMHAFTDAEWKVFSALIIIASPSTGVARFTLREFASDIGQGRSTTSRCLKSLASERVVQTAMGPVSRRYIDYDPGANQHSQCTVSIARFLGLAVPPAGQQTGQQTGQRGVAVPPAGQQWDSSGTAQASDLRKGDPNSLIALEEEQTQSKRATKKPDYSADFEAWYGMYPKKVGREAAKRAYASARKSASKSDLTDGLAAAVSEWRSLGTEKRYIPNPSTWLNQGRWADEHDTQEPDDPYAGVNL